MRMTAENKKPLLPLRDIVIFPSVVVPLFVGRKKSIRALEEVMKTDKSIVLVTQKNSEVDDPQEKDIYSFGCLSKILQLLKLPDGTVKVLVEGQKRAKIKEISDENKKFLNCNIETIENDKETEENKLYALNLIKKFEKLSSLSKKDSLDFVKTLKSLTDSNQIADNISSNLNISINDKQFLLEITNLKKRLEKIYEILEKETSVISMEKRIRVIGKARTKEIIRPKSPPSISKIATTKDIHRHKTKTLQIQKEGGVSIIESALTKNLFIFVGIGDWIEPPSGIGCA